MKSFYYLLIAIALFCSTGAFAGHNFTTQKKHHLRSGLTERHRQTLVQERNDEETAVEDEGITNTAARQFFPNRQRSGKLQHNQINSAIHDYPDSVTRLWDQTFISSGANYAEGRGVAVDSSGNVYVTVNNDGPNKLIKYNANGDTVWSRTYVLLGYKVAIDMGGNVYVYDNGIMKFSPAGDSLWKQRDLDANGITFDGNGNVYATGDGLTGGHVRTAKYDTDGTLLWLKDFGFLGTDRLEGQYIVRDDSGDIYVSGNSQFKVNGRTKYRVIVFKYNANGDSLWMNMDFIASTSALKNMGLGIDNAGNVYTANKDSLKYNKIVKYNSHGVLQWGVLFDSTSSSSTKIMLTVDDVGNSYVTGQSGAEIRTMKIDSNGVIQWQSLSGGDVVTSILRDNSGNIYVAGFPLNTITLRKYNNDGIEQWITNYTGLNPTTSGMVLSKDGNIYLVGGIDSIGSRYALTLKYTPAGNEMWEKRITFSSFNYDYPTAGAVDSSGNVFMIGYDDAIESRNFLVKFSTAGTVVWSQLLDMFSTLNAVEMDSSGNAYVLGEDGFGVALVVKYHTAGGNLPGSYEWIHPVSYNPSFLAVDKAGNIYLTGDSGTPGSLDILTSKYNASGVEQWVTSYNSPANLNDYPRAITIDGSGNVYVCGSMDSIASVSLTLKYNASGVVQWARVYPYAGANTVAVDAQGNVISCGDALTVKYNANGDELQTYQFGSDRILIDRSGNVYSYVGTVTKFSTLDGNPRWAFDATFDSVEAFTFTMDKSGNIYTLGTLYGENNIGYGVTKYRQEAPDTATYRTFAADTLLSKKAVKMLYKKGKLTTFPNVATVVTNAFTRIGKKGELLLGVKHTLRDSLKKYAWLTFTNQPSLGKFYTSAADTLLNYPVDSIRVKKAKRLLKGVTPDRKTFNNFAWEQGVAFNLNLRASKDSVLPKGFGSLTLDSDATYFGKSLQGKSLTEIGKYYDTLMTYWVRYGIDTSTAYAELGSFARLLKRINTAFAAKVDTGNFYVDSANIVKGAKNPYAVTLRGIKNAFESGLLRYSPGKVNEERALFTNESEPKYFKLNQNYPNPFNPLTVISYVLTGNSVVTLKVYDVLGREVTTLINNASLEEGSHQVTFDASQFASGVYFYRLSAEVNSNHVVDVKKMVLIK